MLPHGYGSGHQDHSGDVLGAQEGEGEVWSTLLIVVDFCTTLHTWFEGFAVLGTTSDRCCRHQGPRQLPETRRAFILPVCMHGEILHFEAGIIQPASDRSALFPPV